MDMFVCLFNVLLTHTRKIFMHTQRDVLNHKRQTNMPKRDHWGERQHEDTNGYRHKWIHSIQRPTRHVFRQKRPMYRQKRPMHTQRGVLNHKRQANKHKRDHWGVQDSTLTHIDKSYIETNESCVQTKETYAHTKRRIKSDKTGKYTQKRSLGCARQHTDTHGYILYRDQRDMRIDKRDPCIDKRDLCTHKGTY